MKKMLITLNEIPITINSNQQLINFLLQHPHANKIILAHVHAAHLKEFQDIFPDIFSLLKTSVILNKHADEIFQPIFNSSEKFNWLIKDSMDLKIVAHFYPQYKDKFFEFILTHPVTFQQIFKHKMDVLQISQAFPEYRYLLAMYYFMYQQDINVIMGYALYEKKPRLIMQLKNVIAKSIAKKKLTANCLAKLWAILRTAQATLENKSALRIQLAKLQNFLIAESKNLTLLEYHALS